MADSRLQRVLARLQNLPAIALPTDYPSGGTGNVVEAVQTVKLSEQAAVSLLKLAVYDEDDGEEEERDEDGGGSEASAKYAPGPLNPES